MMNYTQERFKVDSLVRLFFSSFFLNVLQAVLQMEHFKLNESWILLQADIISIRKTLGGFIFQQQNLFFHCLQYTWIHALLVNSLWVENLIICYCCKRVEIHTVSIYPIGFFMFDCFTTLNYSGCN